MVWPPYPISTDAGCIIFLGTSIAMVLGGSNEHFPAVLQSNGNLKPCLIAWDDYAHKRGVRASSIRVFLISDIWFSAQVAAICLLGSGIFCSDLFSSWRYQGSFEDVGNSGYMLHGTSALYSTISQHFKHLILSLHTTVSPHLPTSFGVLCHLQWVAFDENINYGFQFNAIPTAAALLMMGRLPPSLFYTIVRSDFCTFGGWISPIVPPSSQRERGSFLFSF